MLAVVCLLPQGCASWFGSGGGDEVAEEDEERIVEPSIKDIPPAGLNLYTSNPRSRRAELSARNDTGLPKGSLMDVLFDFDRATLRQDALPLLEENAERLKESGVRRLLLEGRGDEIGTAAYNIVLGDRRARTVKAYLEELGLDVQFKTTSYGKDRPLCFQHNNDCMQRNRSVHFVVRDK
jgi:peptidoglycan-associated lipoprotein